jgi:hypothetical protein
MNSSYDHQSDTISLQEDSPNRELVLSSNCFQTERVQQVNDQANIHQHPNLDDTSVSIIDKNNHHHHRLHDVPIEQQVRNNEDVNNNFSDDNSYFSLKHLLNQRHGRRDEDSHLSQRVRNFYKEQDALIDDYQRVYSGRNEKLDKQAQTLKRQTNILTKVSLAVNIVRINS